MRREKIYEQSAVCAVRRPGKAGGGEAAVCDQLLNMKTIGTVRRIPTTLPNFFMFCGEEGRFLVEDTTFPVQGK